MEKKKARGLFFFKIIDTFIISVLIKTNTVFSFSFYCINLFFFRYFAGQKEYEVELQFSSGLTGYPDRVKTGWEEARDGEEPEAGSSGDVSMEAGSNPGLVLRKYVFYVKKKTLVYMQH